MMQKIFPVFVLALEGAGIEYGREYPAVTFTASKLLDRTNMDRFQRNENRRPPSLRTPVIPMSRKGKSAP